MRSFEAIFHGIGHRRFWFFDASSTSKRVFWQRRWTTCNASPSKQIRVTKTRPVKRLLQRVCIKHFSRDRSARHPRRYSRLHRYYVLQVGVIITHLLLRLICCLSLAADTYPCTGCCFFRGASFEQQVSVCSQHPEVASYALTALFDSLLLLLLADPGKRKKL